ncbi:MAG: THUMP domain-containing protein, partial [Ignisphaera sp.]
MGDFNIIDKTIDILKKYSLCDRCLGRLFGYLGKGMSNLERGRILKSVVVLEIHRRLNEKEIDIEVAKTILLNAQRIDAIKTLGLRGSENELRPCSICGNKIEELIDSYSQKVALTLLNLNVSSFRVGISSAQEYMSKEEAIAREFGLLYKETLKRELKREIGKKVASLINIQPNFDEPEVIAIVDLSTNNIEVNYPSLILYGYYWKYGRMISQNIWYTKEGRKKYPLSLEEAIKHVSQLINASNYSIHIAGREDVDVRVLGTGRPLAVEFKVLGKRIDMEFIENKLNSITPWLKFK